MGHGIPNLGSDGSRRKYRVGGAVLPPQRAEMPKVRGGPRPRAGVPADTPEPVDGVSLPVWSDLQFVYGHAAGAAPSDACPGRVVVTGHLEGRDDRSAIAGTEHWLRSSVEFASRATSARRTTATERRLTGYGNRT